MAAATAQPLVLSPGVDHRELGPRLESLEDVTKRWSLADVRGDESHRFKPPTGEIPNHGFSKSAHWYRIKVSSTFPDRQRFYLEMPLVVVDRIEFFVEQQSGSARFDRHLLGDLVPGGGRLLDLSAFVIPFDLDPSAPKWIYVRAETEGSLQMPLQVWSPDAYVKRVSERNLFYGPIYGLLLMLLLYNLILYYMLADRIHLHFSLYVASAALYIGYFTGDAQAHLFGASPWLANTGYPLAMLLVNIFMYVFTQRFLNLAHVAPRLNGLLRLFIIIGLCVFPLSLVASYRLTLMVTIGVIVSGVIVATVTGFHVLRLGYKPARFYVLAWSAFFLGIVVFALQKAGLLPTSVLTDHGHILGILAMLVLLPAGLASRISVLREEKEQALRRRIDALNKVIHRAEVIATGDLTQQPSEGGEDDAILDRMVSGLRGIVEQVRSVSAQVVAAAEELAAQARAQEESARGQATAAEESRRTMDSLGEGSRDIAESATSVGTAADHARENAELVADRIKRLDASIVRITEALGQVKAIANKSELLALNAALEATRAGSAGRGFSLVAEQMKRLAEDTKGLVETITTLMAEIEQSRRDAVVATSQGEEAVGRVTQAASRIGLIAAQQHGGTEQAVFASEEIGDAAARVAMASTEALRASSDLAGLARELGDVVSRFKL